MTQPALSVHCSSCGADAYPSLNLNDRMAMVPACPSCGHEHENVSANDLAETPIAPDRLAKVLPIRDSQTPSPRQPWAPPAVGSGFVDVFTTIRERLNYLDLELAKSAGYATERKKLARMLMAAEKTK